MTDNAIRDRANTFLYYLMGGVGGLIALCVANGFAHLVVANAVRATQASPQAPAGLGHSVSVTFAESHK